jgi:Flp pilus assembly protein TadG
MSFRFLRDRSGVSATEFAIIAPVLLIIVLGIIDGWSYAASVLSARAAVKAGVNYVLQGGGETSTVQAVALAAWTNPPTDADVQAAQICYCSGASASCDVLCASGSPPTAVYHVVATGTWIPPAPINYIMESRPISHDETIRVR